MQCWSALLLIYRQIDISLSGVHFSHRLDEREIRHAVDSFERFPSLVEKLTDGLAGIRYDIVDSGRPLTSLTEMGQGLYWPSPDDTGPELSQHVASGSYDSVFVFWPQSDFAKGDSIPSGGWGLGLGAHPWSYGATYATVANAESWVWDVPLKGEVWLHEWLHGVCQHFAECGYEMPDGDADGGSRHGYEQSPECGWVAFYRDLMRAQVQEEDGLKGIPLHAWQEHPPVRGRNL